MSSIVIQGNTSGSITVEAPSVAGTNTLTLPAITSTLATTADISGPAFSAYMTNGSAGISTGAATFTKIILDTEEFDTASCFDSSTNYRFTPTVAGYYQINAAVTYTVAASTAGAGAVIYKNGSGLCWGTASGTSNMYPTAFLSSLIYLNGSTDYIELYIYNGTGATSSTSYGRSYCYMNGYLARAV